VSVLTHAQFDPPLQAVRPRRPRLVPPLPVAETPAGSPWLDWARRLDAMARIGAAFAAGPHEVRRYAELGAMAKEMLAELHARPQVELPDLYAPTEGYVTPKVDVRVAVFDEAGRILLVREAADGRWSMPGGWADVGDSPAVSAAREVREESGFEVELTKVIGVFDAHNPHSTFSAYKLLFAGRIVGGTAGGDHETDGVGFFAVDDLPPLCRYRTPLRVLAEGFEHWAAPDRSSFFE
jgi:ADP-ribose pyrophosphatase YjhB (NUDIX family)